MIIDYADFTCFHYFAFSSIGFFLFTPLLIRFSILILRLIRHCLRYWYDTNTPLMPHTYAIDTLSLRCHYCRFRLILIGHFRYYWPLLPDIYHIFITSLRLHIFGHYGRYWYVIFSLMLIRWYDYFHYAIGHYAIHIIDSHYLHWYWYWLPFSFIDFHWYFIDTPIAGCFRWLLFITLSLRHIAFFTYDITLPLRYTLPHYYWILPLMILILRFDYLAIAATLIFTYADCLMRRYVHHTLSPFIISALK